MQLLCLLQGLKHILKKQFKDESNFSDKLKLCLTCMTIWAQIFLRSHYLNIKKCDLFSKIEFRWKSLKFCNTVNFFGISIFYHKLCRFNSLYQTCSIYLLYISDQTNLHSFFQDYNRKGRTCFIRNIVI